MQLAVQKGIERLGNQQRLLLADGVELQMGSESGNLDRTQVRWGRPDQYPLSESVSVRTGIWDFRAGSAGTFMRATGASRSRLQRGMRFR